METLKIQTMTMTKKYKILGNYIKDLSSETPDIETYLFVKEKISTYQLNIDINSKALKNKMVEVNTTFKFQDKEENKKKSHFEIIYSSIIKMEDSVKNKNEMEKIILCDLQMEIYPKLEKIFLNIIKDSGFPNLKLNKKVDFEQLYNQRLN